MTKYLGSKELLSDDDPMRDITLLAIELAKNIFQLSGLNQKSEVVLKQKLSRNRG